MSRLIIFGGLVLVCSCLAALAIVTFIKAQNLSLPLSPLTTFLPIILPILFPPLVLLSNRTFKSPSSTRFFARATPHILQLLLRLFPHAHLLLLTVLATLLSQPGAAPAGAISCPSLTRWQSLYSAHDAESIRRIQDQLSCCGLRTPRDMAWPFNSPKGRACVDTYGRDTACGLLWENALRGVAAADLGIVVTLAVFQVIAMYLSGRVSPAAWLPFVGGRTQGREHAAENDRRSIMDTPAVRAISDVEAEQDTEDQTEDAPEGDVNEDFRGVWA